jgi:hypothetical protein
MRPPEGASGGAPLATRYVGRLAGEPIRYPSVPTVSASSAGVPQRLPSGP